MIILNVKLERDYEGLELRQAIIRSYPGLPIILWTAYDPDNEMFASIPEKFLVYKTHNMKELQQKIEQALHSSRWSWQ